MPDQAVHYPHGWGNFIIGNVVNDRGIRGALYRATHKSTYARVLLKVSPPPNPLDKPLLEYEIVSKLSECIHVLRVTELTKLNLDPQDNESRDAIVCEDFGESVPVSQLVEIAPSGLDLSTFITIIFPILEALHFSHSKDILHGDVNPSCMLYNPTTKIAKLYDFSSAITMTHTFASYILSRPDGTPGFVPTNPRYVDTRFDVYSVGVSMYYMLSGKMPVKPSASKEPPTLHELSSEIPAVISNIVQKAMMEDLNDRYQSIFGLLTDLRTCAEYIMLSAAVPEIGLGSADLTTLFQPHGVLQGRDSELAAMREVLHRVASSKKSEVIALSGPGSVCKARVMNVLHTDALRMTARCSDGNFRKNCGHSLDVIVQCLRGLFRILLATTKPNLLGKWRLRIIRMCGPRLFVLTNIVPEAEILIGKQSEELDGIPTVESKSTFYRLFSDLIIAFTEDSLVVLFLENLQWADSSALELLSEIIESCSTNLLLVCSVCQSQNNENLEQFFEIQKTRISITQVTLNSLNHMQLNDDICLCLRPKHKTDTLPLALFLSKRCKGSSFLAKQVVRVIYQKRILFFDWESQTWKWDPDEVESVMCNGNFLQFFDNAIGSLPYYTQLVLKVAAHVGFVFSSTLLSKLTNILPAEVDSSLQIALCNEFIQKSNDTNYRFSNEIIRTAAESSLKEQKLDMKIHMEIGKVLLFNIDDPTSDLFSAVRHMNAALPFLDHPLPHSDSPMPLLEPSPPVDETANISNNNDSNSDNNSNDDNNYYSQEAQAQRDRVRRINLRAAKLGNYGIAFEFALDCSHTAMQLLNPNAWETDYEETLDIYRVCVKSEYIAGNAEKAIQLHDELMQHCKTTMDKLASLLVLIHLQNGGLKYYQLPELGRKCFELMGYNIKEKIEQEELLATKAEVDKLMANRSVSDLRSLPPMTDPLNILLLEVGFLIANSYYVDPLFYFYVHVILTKVTLEKGWGPRSGISLSTFSMILSRYCSEYSLAREYSELAVYLSDKYHPQSVQFYSTACVAYMHSMLIGSYHVKNTIPIFHDTLHNLFRYGDRVFCRPAATYLFGHRHFAGENLFTVLNDLIKVYKKLTYSQAVKAKSFHLRGHMEYCLTMLGPLAEQSEAHSLLLDDKETTNQIGFLGFWNKFYQMSMLFHFGQYEKALTVGNAGLKDLPTITSFLLLSRYIFYHTMTLCAMCSTASEDKRKEYLQAIADNQIKQKEYRDISPLNCGYLCTIVDAVLSSISNRPPEETSQLFEKATSSAEAAGFVNEEALVNELYGVFLLSQNLKLAGSLLIRNAIKKFYKYGAAAKCKQLEEKYFTEGAKKSSEGEKEADMSEIRPIVNADFTFAKASQLLSQEIDVDKLVEKAMDIIVEHAGVDHGVLMLREKDGKHLKDVYTQLHVKAIWELNPSTPLSSSSSTIEAEIGGDKSKTEKPGKLTIHSSKVLLNNSFVPESLVSFVAHSRRMMILNDIAGSDFAFDEYFLNHPSRSALCVPIQQKGKLKGVLFLESYSSNKIFSPQRLKVIDFLCAQIGISLENALLYATITNSETQYQILADTIPQFVFAARPDGSIYFANKRLLAYVGKIPADYNWTEYIHPDHQKDVEKIWITAITTGLEYQTEYLLKRYDNTYKWFLAIAAPVRNQNNVIIKWFGTLTDIDEKKKEVAEVAMRAQIEASEKKYRLLAEAIPIMVWSANSDGVADYANQKWVDYMGFNVTKVPFSWGPDSIYFEDWLNIKDKWMRALRDKTNFEAEYRVKRGKDGVFRWHLIRAIPMHEKPSSDSVRWFGTCTDVHSQKMAEIELVIAREAAEQTAQNQAAFLANMSHEIRTPLNGIIGMIDILMDSTLTPEQRDYSNTIQRSGDSLLNIVNDILDFSKIQAGKMILRESEFHVEDTVADVCELLITLANNKGLALSFLVSNDVPPVLIGDSTRLRQILINLIGNGIKFTSSGEIFVHCKLTETKSIEPGTANLEFRISDSGVGLTVPQQLMLFKPFFQADTSTTRKSGGTGLGLAISKQLVNLMGGDIHVESEEGVGSCFYFNAKFKCPAAFQVSGTASPGKVPLIITPSLPKARAVVFYDQPSRKVVLSFHLSAFGIPITPCDNLAAAKEAVQQQGKPCDRLCIIIDVSSKKDILDFINTTVLCNINPSPLIIVITTQHERVLYEKYPSPTHVCCLIKPVTHSKLAGSLASIFNSKPSIIEEKINKIPASPKFNPSFPNFGNNIGNLSPKQPENKTDSLVPSINFNNLNGNNNNNNNNNYNNNNNNTNNKAPSKFVKASNVNLNSPTKFSNIRGNNTNNNETRITSPRNFTNRSEYTLLIHTLVVEDNAVNVKVIMRRMEKVGSRVTIAGDGKEAVELYKANPDLYDILMDLFMPNMDGMQATREIRKWEEEHDHKPVPIISLTANVMPDVVRDCLGAGMNDYVSKPIDFTKLYASIARLLARPHSSSLSSSTSSTSSLPSPSRASSPSPSPSPPSPSFSVPSSASTSTIRSSKLRTASSLEASTPSARNPSEIEVEPQKKKPRIVSSISPEIP